MAKKKTTTRKSRTTKGKAKEPSGIRALFSPEGGWKALLSGDTLRVVIGIIILIIALFMLLSFTSFIINGYADQARMETETYTQANNYGGGLGLMTAQYFMNGNFGVCAYFIPLFLLMLSMKLINAYKVRLWKWFLNFSILMIWGSIAFSIAQKNFLPKPLLDVGFKWGGAHGDAICDYSTNMLGLTVTILIMVALALFYLIYLTGETINWIRYALNPKEYLIKTGRLKKPGTEPEDVTEEEEPEEPETEPEEPETEPEDEPTEETEPEEETQTLEFETLKPAEEPKDETPETETDLVIDERKEEDKADGTTLAGIDDMEPYDPRKDLEYYKFPTLSLLKHYNEDGPNIDMKEQNENKDRIVSVLHSFGVEISGIKATIGPTITLYEVTPAPGVRISKIRNLEDDIALSLSALGIRIIAPIPGKGTIGIEVPNKNPQIVSMESILNSKRFQETKYELPIALGKTITNEVFMVDLAKMPHLLVAGATGQGKSVGLNAIITSLLYKKHPAELKFVMVDPKKVEFSVYTPIENHFLAKLPENEDPIITDVTKVVQTLKSLCQLMDHRYDLLKKAKVRNVKEYNAKFKARVLNPQNGHEYMPYIVIIIDEFGDLIMTAGKEVELPIARIAQLARAVGMHMVIATQRPTTNIITGTIKANFPARMAFKVMAQIDSRTILDQSGANQLIGRGDMLFLCGNTPTRVQCAFVDTPEVEQIVAYVSEQQGYLSAFELPEPLMDGEGAGPADLGDEALDDMFDEAARLIVVQQQGSTSLIQRKMAIGYNRAGRLMDQLERAGIVGPVRGSKPREVLVQDVVELDSILETLHQ